MIQITANVSPLIPRQFPAIFRENGPNFVAFMKAYFQWMEQQGNSLYYGRNYYNIKDIDNTFDQFIVYFKEKYLVNINFSIEANIKMIIKHALDIYRSKGTERCTTLLFQLAFNEDVDFYYPSTDLFKLSDGQWLIPQYLELSLNWQSNVKLQQKEVKGVFSGATAFVDDVIERTTNGRYEDVAYISAVSGLFETGEQVIPTDGSLPIANCPFIIGSLNQVEIPGGGSGLDYTVGSLIPITTINGNSGLLKVLSTTTQSGSVNAMFIDGGWGYATWQNYANITFTSANGTFSNGTNIYTYYPNNAVNGIGLITGITETSNAGSIQALILSGNLDSNQFFTYANAIVANTTQYSQFEINPTNLYISNTTVFLNNLLVDTSNLEFVHYFYFLDTLTEPMATINYINANGTLLVGANVFTYFANNLQMGMGTIMQVNEANTTAGTILVAIVTGNVDNTFYTTANAIGANLATSNGYTNSTAVGYVIASSNVITLALNNVSGTFVAGEEVFQMGPLGNIEEDQKISGYGIVEAFSGNTLTVNGVVGIFVNEVATVQGAVSTAQANVVSIALSAGLVNVTGSFFSSPYSYVTTPLTTSSISEIVPSGTSFSLTVANTLINTQNVQINIDDLLPYLNVSLNAATYGFPANPTANLTNGTMGSSLNLLDQTIGELTNIVQTGGGEDFTQSPFVVVDYPLVSYSDINNDLLEISSSGNFVVGEEITQAASNVQGTVVGSNSTFLYIQRFNYSNDFVLTTNSTTTILGLTSGSVANVLNVDYDYFSTYMGRNAEIDVSILAGENALATVQVVDSGFGFVNGESINIGSNGAIGTAIVTTQGTGQGYYFIKGGFLSDQKRIFDGYFWQNFSYELLSSVAIDKYWTMIQELTHPAGMILFADFIHDSSDGNALNIQNANIVTGFQNVMNVTATVAASMIRQPKQISASRTAKAIAEFNGSYIWKHANNAANTAGNV